jgi:hypothetical protein
MLKDRMMGPEQLMILSAMILSCPSGLSASFWKKRCIFAYFAYFARGFRICLSQSRRPRQQSRNAIQQPARRAPIEHAVIEA